MPLFRKATYVRYKDRLQLFCNAIPATLSVWELNNFHIQEWVDSCPNLSPGSKRNHCRSVQRAMKWAVRRGYIDSSPVAHLEKPAANRRAGCGGLNVVKDRVLGSTEMPSPSRASAPRIGSDPSGPHFQDHFQFDRRTEWKARDAKNKA